MPLNSEPRCVDVCPPRRLPEITLRSTSDTPNMPIMAGMNPMPPVSSTEPKVKRG